MGAFPGVDPHVTMELARVLERPGADLALVGTLFGMDPPVYAEVLLDAEALVAELASERFLSGMGAVMSGQASRHGESFRADVATVRIVSLLGMGAIMSLVRRLRWEHFIAQMALDTLLVAGVTGYRQVWTAYDALYSKTRLFGCLDGCHRQRILAVEADHFWYFEYLFCNKEIYFISRIVRK